MRSARWRLIGLFVLATLLLGPSGSAYVRTDVVDENYLTGYLYWQNGKGGISWSAPHASDDNVDPGNDSAGLFDEFLSAPVPQALYINVSRVIQIDLFVQGAADVQLDVEVSIGSAFLTGGADAYTDWILYCSAPGDKYCADPAQRPTAPGYSFETHRTQAELDTLPKGSTIHLRIIHRDSNRIAYGLLGDHGSTLRIPIFSPDEVLYRVPKYAYQTPAPKAESPGPTLDPVTDLVNQVLSSGTLGGLAMLPIASRRSTRRLFVGVLALAALGGCTGDPQHPDSRDAPSGGAGLGGSASNYIIPDSNNETGLVSSTRGSLYGVVSDTDGLPVNGAYVALIGAPRSTRTDPYGRFHFKDLVPETYHVRIDRDGFKPYEGDVRVDAASITKLEIVLEFVVVKDVTQRPHRHDYWFDGSGKPVDSVVLLDNAAPHSQNTDAGSFWVLPPPRLVKPGTVDVELNVTWSGGSSVVLRIGIPNDPRNDTYLYPRESGHAFHVRTTWEMTDPGHAAYSYWRTIAANALDVPCAQYMLGASDPNCPRNLAKQTLWDSTANAYGFHLRVTLHKGVVPLEPPHPDHWGEGRTLPVIANETQAIARYCRSSCPRADRADDSAQLYLPYPIAEHTGTTRRAYNATWAVKGFVPFETKWLDVTLRASRSFAATPDAPWKLFSRDAKTTHFGTCDPIAPDNIHAGLEAPLHATDPGGLGWTYRIPVTTAGADPPYAKSSNWCFYAAPADQNAYMVDDYQQLWAPAQVAKMMLTLSVDAHKDPIPNP